MVNQKEIETKIIDLINSNKKDNPKESIEYFAQGLSKIIADAIKGGTVSIEIGEVLVTTPGGVGANTNKIIKTIM